LNNYSETDSDSELDSSIDSNESDDRAVDEVDTGSDNDSDATRIVDVVDDLTWSSVLVNNMKRLDFTGNSGLNITPQSPEDPLEYFESFLTSDIMSPVVDETNHRAAQLRAKAGLKGGSRLHQWVDTGMSEMMSFIALLLYMGVIWKPELKLYWTTNAMLETPYVRRLMGSLC